MNILMIGRERTALQDKKDVKYGNFQDRLLEYSKYANLFVIACSDARRSKSFANVKVYGARVNPTLYFFDSVRLALKVSRENKIDVVTSQDAFFTGAISLIIARLIGAKFVVQLHSDFIDNPAWLGEGKTNLLLNTVGKCVMWHADAVRAVSARVAKRAIGAGAKNVYESPIYTDISAYISNREKPLAKFANFDKKVLFIGRLVKSKNVDLLLDSVPKVLKEHPNTAFIIVGDGPERKRLEAKAGEYGENIFFEGSRYPTLPYYATCDLFAFPSKYEGWGLVLVEALASGKPVVTTDIGCVGEIVIDGENGIVVHDPTPENFAIAINRLLADKQLRERMGAAGQKKVLKEINKEELAKRLMAIFEKAAKNGQ